MPNNPNLPAFNPDQDTIVYTMTQDYVAQFMENQGYAPLTPDEWEALPFQFADFDYDFLGEVIHSLRSPSALQAG